MKVLVLGGSQFVGLHLVQHLAAHGHDVTVLNRGQTSTQLPAGVQRLVADRSDEAAMRTALSGKDWDVVYDVSGFVMVAGRSNIDMLVDLLDGHCGRYVFTSSIMAYFQTSGVCPWTEDFATNIDGPNTYGGFKAMVERTIFERHRKTGFPAVSVRPAAIYGPDNNIYDMEAPMFLRLLRGLPIILPHDGLVTCSYGHVDDLVRAMVEMGTNPAAVGEVFNVTAEAVTVNEYVRVLSEIVGKPADVVYIPTADLAKLQRPPFGHLFGKAHHSVLSIEKVQRLLGHKNQWGFKEGHAQTFEWFMRSGLADVQDALRDPIWFASYDFAHEANVAAALRGGA
ncbi:MAG: NAD-dependent epimerase/dehydratase family protein [Dehalococcoidia bacterium]